MADTGRFALAKYNYKAQGDHELSVDEGERLRLVDDSKDWWMVENCNQQFGFVPSNFVKKEKIGIFHSLKKRFRSIAKPGDQREAIDFERPPVWPTSNSPATPHVMLGAAHIVSERLQNELQVVALFDYVPERADELELRKNEKLFVCEKSHDGWWKGRNPVTAQLGWFPSNFVRECYVSKYSPKRGNSRDASDSGHSSHSPVDQMNINDGYGVQENSLNENQIYPHRALFRFKATNPDELSFEKHEIISVLENPNTGLNWLKAMNERQEKGLVPRNFIQEIDHPPSRLTPAEKDTSTTTRSSFERNSESGSSSESENAQFFINRIELKNKPWYFGRLSRAQCDELLNTYGHIGDYVVRDSETGSANDFSVSLRAFPRNKHFKINVNLSEKLLSIGSRSFSCLQEVIEHYEKIPICTMQSGEKLCLKRPLNAPRKV